MMLQKAAVWRVSINLKVGQDFNTELLRIDCMLV